MIASNGETYRRINIGLKVTLEERRLLLARMRRLKVSMTALIRRGLDREIDAERRRLERAAAGNPAQ